MIASLLYNAYTLIHKHCVNALITCYQLKLHTCFYLDYGAKKIQIADLTTINEHVLLLIYPGLISKHTSSLPPPTIRTDLNILRMTGMTLKEAVVEK